MRLTTLCKLKSHRHHVHRFIPTHHEQKGAGFDFLLVISAFSSTLYEMPIRTSING